MPVTEQASIRCEQSGDILRMAITGRLDADATSIIWPEAITKYNSILPEQLHIDASGVNYCDSAGIGLLLKLRNLQQGRNKTFSVEGLKPEFNKLMTLFDPGKIAAPAPAGSFSRRAVEEVGKSVAMVVRDIAEEINFIGELSVKMTDSLLHPFRLRWQDQC